MLSCACAASKIKNHSLNFATIGLRAFLTIFECFKFIYHFFFSAGSDKNQFESCVVKISLSLFVCCLSAASSCRCLLCVCVCACVSDLFVCWFCVFASFCLAVTRFYGQTLHAEIRGNCFSSTCSSHAIPEEFEWFI